MVYLVLVEVCVFYGFMARNVNIKVFVTALISALLGFMCIKAESQLAFSYFMSVFLQLRLFNHHNKVTQTHSGFYKWNHKSLAIYLKWTTQGHWLFKYSYEEYKTWEFQDWFRWGIFLTSIASLIVTMKDAQGSAKDVRATGYFLIKLHGSCHYPEKYLCMWFIISKGYTQPAY